MAYVIAMTGTHGTGKTTATYQRAAEAKLRNPGKQVMILQEVAAGCPMGINQVTTLESQLWIFTTQISRELYLASQCDILVCDRTAMDAIAYTSVMSGGGNTDAHKLCHKMFDLVKNHLGFYDEIHLMRIEDGDYCHSDGIRDTENKPWRELVEKVLIWLWNRSGVTQEDRFRYPGKIYS